uniref:Uncharacterized protein n=1 Tax=Pseudictyota dubia TaxID=2749911 RepID=A0A7R9Z7I3_9STRA|mmetsp:Transcript_26133/g.48696  ORF Transcript_26133/g.48696 Transcript_26133/m.48696 type:complete len:233 (+) Transcript_26133:40-738(+)|eukprot:CAMPEP_0197452330 /NCGR_PEP_ID=MMETSP1175-20131217/31783_1 /TAXON_ID=1003142 /ORGANISM="Triceratium dubium, Strain CCMP147" /LENGTH=232 /DNA_ID=CAMNT_0042985311 /DNA_START=25 /DNA_END=723 /DNA_ORIENTATION=-
MAINKSFANDDSSSDGSSGEREPPEPSAPLLEVDERDNKSFSPPLVVAAPIASVDDADVATNNDPGDHEGNIDDAAHSGEESEHTRTTAAGVAAGIVGFLFGGPVLALLAGGGTFYAARRRDSVAGDFARAVGDVALTARDKAEELDKKHHIVDKTKSAAEDAWEKAKQLEEEHHFLDKVRNALVIALEKTMAFNDQHHVLDKVTHAMSSFFRFVSTKVWEESNDTTPDQAH